MSVGRVLVYGGKGALGAACVSKFKAQKWWVGSIDFKINEEADLNVVVNGESSLLEQESSLLKQIETALGSNKLDAVVCVAGGWAGGSASSKDFIKNCELTWQQSVVTSILATSIAARYLKSDGLLALTGAAAALSPSPGMIGYGMAKAAVLHLTKSVAAKNGGLPETSTTVAILPETLDTPMNRKWMPDADTSTWTPLEFVSGLFVKWINGENRPSNGSLMKLITRNNFTDVTAVE